MFSVYQLITIIIVVIAVIFLAIFIQLNAFKNNQRRILFVLITLSIFLLIIDILISYNLYEISFYLFPLYYPVLFIIYPLFYLYFKTFAFINFQISLANSYKHLILTCIVALLIGVYFADLPYERKIDLVSGKMMFTETAGVGYLVQFTVYILYYLQLIVYGYFYFRLIKKLRIKDSDKNEKFNTPIIKWIVVYFTGTLTFEIIILITAVNHSYIYSKISDQIITLVYLFFVGFLGINQSVFLIRTRLYQSTSKSTTIESKENYSLINNADEKQEFKRLIEMILKEKKLYLDPNLKLEIFAKKIHVPQKKLSQVIHEVYDKNFTNFINDYRIQEAINILNSEEKISMYVLSHKVGFNSRSTFNRAFKDYTGEIPRDYVIKHKISND